MRTLLLADDSLTVQRVIALTFAEEPIRILTAGDGRQAMEKLAGQRPDIVLAATTLPMVNGYDLAKFMRGRPDSKDVPILLLSGAFETVDDAKLAASGASGVIEKPVEPTIVISRVKELLGMKAEAKPSATGRLITPAAPQSDTKRPAATPPPAVTSTRPAPSRWDELRDKSGLEANARSVEDPSTRSADYLDTLDAAFDTLDQQLSGRAPGKQMRNPSGPLTQSASAVDPRSPGKLPPSSSGVPGNPVFEVDEEWFGGGDQAASEASANRRELAQDLADPDLKAPADDKPDSIFEVDDEWFAEGNQARAARLAEQQLLAAEMGIHEVELPEAPASLDRPAPASDLDFEFGLDDMKPQPLEGDSPAPIDSTARVVPEPVVEAVVVLEPSALVPPPVIVATAPLPQSERAPAIAPGVPVAHVAPASPVAAALGGSVVADDFAQLLAFEQGERHHPPAPAPPVITDDMIAEIAAKVAARQAPPAPVAPVITDQIIEEITAKVAARQVPPPPPEPVAPVITDEVIERITGKVAERYVPPPPPSPVITDGMLDQIAASVAERLKAGVVGEELRDAMRSAVRESVRAVVSETSERLVREEIDRIRSKPRT